MLPPITSSTSSMTFSSRPKKKPSVRSLNQEFKLFRTNAIQRRSIHKFKTLVDVDDVEEDRVGLLNDHEAEDVDHKLSTLPAFLRRSTALEFDFSLMQSKVAELEKVLRESAARPFFDDGEEGQRRKSVETLSKELETLAAKSHKRLREIREDVKSRRRKALEQELGENVLRHLTTTLRDVLEKFASVQGTHSKHTRSREEKSKEFFSDYCDEDVELNTEDLFPVNQRLNTQQLIELEETTKMLARRERDINQVVTSISDLNAIFKDLAQMVSEQGVVVDRIDHNIEHTNIKVEQGLQQLKKAERYQKKNRKMKCIVILAVIFVILLCILVVKVS